MHKIDHIIQQRVDPVVVNVIGAGGTGSHVMQTLADMNVVLKNINHPGMYVTLWDDDVVENFNVGKQVFSRNDIGKHKATTIMTNINRAYGTHWDAKTLRIKEVDKNSVDNNITLRPRIIISCVDNVSTRKIIANNLEDGVYWLDFGNSKSTGQVVLGYKPHRNNSKRYSKLKTVLEMFPDLESHEDEETISCSMFESLFKQDMLINATIAKLGCNILWNLFTKKQIEYHGLFLNLETMKVNPILC